MKNRSIVAIVLIVLGILILAYRGFSYRSEEKILDLGPIHATAETTKTVPIPRVLGWALIGGGAAILLLGGRKQAL